MSISRAKRFEILQRDGFRCRYCGATPQDGVKLEVDHVSPRAHGGPDDYWNLITACFDCNRGKRDRDANRQHGDGRAYWAIKTDNRETTEVIRDVFQWVWYDLFMDSTRLPLPAYEALGIATDLVLEAMDEWDASGDAYLDKHKDVFKSKDLSVSYLLHRYQRDPISDVWEFVRKHRPDLDAAICKQEPTGAIQ